MARRQRTCLPVQETREMQAQPLHREDPLQRKWQPAPVLLSGKSHGQRSLVSYSPWSHKELGMTEHA